MTADEQPELKNRAGNSGIGRQDAMLADKKRLTGISRKSDINSRCFRIGPFMFPTEEHSLEAINKLQATFPYAATLLIYAVLERCLKLHLLESRKTLTNAEVNLDLKVGRQKQKLSEARGLDDDDFIRKFLVHCTLGTLERIYRVPDRRYSASRNKVFHSDLFLRHQRRSDYTSRDKENRDYLRTAREQLIDASERYFRQKITESNGLLRFERSRLC